MIHNIGGDLLTSDCKYIVHQCNCKTVGNGAGLAYYLNKKFPYANTYIPNHHRTPGTIEIMGDGEKDRFVINMYAQNYPGRTTDYETAENRLNWFKQCLERIGEIQDFESIAFPYEIGCGLAGGNWEKYCSLIEEFSKNIQDKGDVFIVRLVK